ATDRPAASGAVRVERFRYAPVSLQRIGYRGDARFRAVASPGVAVVLPAYVLAFRKALTHAVRDFAPDVVHAHWWLPAGWLAARLGRPFVVTSHGSDVRLLERSWVLRSAGRRVFGRARVVTAVSEFLARDIVRLVGSIDCVEVTPMPVNVALFESGRSVAKVTPPRLLYAGNLVASKGVDVLIEAFGILRRTGVSCSLKILGEGPDRPRLQRIARELGVDGEVAWADFVPQERMPAEYGCSAVTVLPTRGQAEGLGLVLVEALCAGSAVVGTPAGGIPEVIEDGVTGLLARDGNAAHLAEQLDRLLSTPDLRRALTAAGADRVRRTYAPDAAATRFLELYDHAADRHPTR
ncbi:MAG: glycosyltransferase, partial [Gemmatimonadales bacterium]|nr:glycosyltransferase [Gemmatimonadales bacterium]